MSTPIIGATVENRGIIFGLSLRVLDSHFAFSFRVRVSASRISDARREPVMQLRACREPASAAEERVDWLRRRSSSEFENLIFVRR